jgi:uncharacterized protein DUF6468
MTLSIALDIVVAVLLVATIAYATVLDRRFRMLRSARAEIEGAVVGFNVATARAESAIGDLKAGTEAGTRELKPLMATARQIADDLAFLVERGNELADRLDVGVSAARAIAAKGQGKIPPRSMPAAAPAKAVNRETDSVEREVSDAEHALLKALRSVR